MKNKKERIVIIGAGRIGKAFGSILKKKKLSVELWDKKDGIVRNQKPLPVLARGAGIFIICVPSWGVRDVLVSLYPHVSREAILLFTAKGIEKESLKMVDDIAHELLPKNNFGVLAGPMLAEELDRNLHGIGVLGSSSRSVFRKINSIFSGTHVYLQYSSDVRGAVLSGILKNIYALGLGIADGLGWGNNAKGWLITQSFKEMVFIGGKLGAKKQTIEGVAGFGDLTTCSFSEHSRNRRAGEELLKKHFISNSEGILSFQSLISLLGGKTYRLPLLGALRDIILRKKNPYKVFESFFSDSIFIWSDKGK